MRALTRVLALLVALAVLAVAAWYGWLYYEKELIIREQARVIEALGETLDKVWSGALLADLSVDKIDLDPETGHRRVHARFTQYRPGSEEVAFQRSMVLLGEELYIDALVVQFERDLVEAGDGLKGHSMLLFRRAFGDRQAPADGPLLYTTGQAALDVPELFQVDPQPSEFERELWQRFWRYADDREAASKAGVRLAQGEAPHVRARLGQTYALTLRAAGGLEIKPRLPVGALPPQPQRLGRPGGR